MANTVERFCYPKIPQPDIAPSITCSSYVTRHERRDPSAGKLRIEILVLRRRTGTRNNVQPAQKEEERYEKAIPEEKHI